MLHFINEVFFTFIEGVIHFVLYLCLADKRDFLAGNKFKSAMFLVFFTIFSYWATMYLLPGIHTMAIAVFLTVLLSFITGTSKLTSAVSTVLLMLFAMVSELVILVILMYALNIDLSMVNNPGIKLIALCAVRIPQLVVVFTFFVKKRNVLKLKIKPRWNSFANLQVFQIFLFSMFFVSSTFAAISKEETRTYQILLFVILLFFMILSYYEYMERRRLLNQNHKLEVQQSYVKNLEEFVNTLRKEKHDIANHLSTINVLCKLNAPDVIEKIDAYLSKLTAQFQTSYRSFSTGSDYINALLAVKSNFADENNIKFTVDFKAPVYELNIPDSDLISIFGNIIDNALDALVQDKANSNRQISISTYIVQDSYYINISNNGPEISKKNISKIFDSGFSTKGEKMDRGFGLYITKQTIIGNNGTVNVTSNPEETNFIITFAFKNVPQSVGFNTEVLRA